MRIVIYTKPNCVQCDYTKRKLTEMELTYEEIDISLDKAAERDVRNMVIEDKPVLQMPVVVVSNSTRVVSWSGFKIEKIRGIRETGDY